MSKKEIELLRDLCRKNDVSYMLAKTIFDEYVPYLENAHKKHKYEYEIYTQNLNGEYMIGWPIIEVFIKSRKRLSQRDKFCKTHFHSK